MPFPTNQLMALWVLLAPSAVAAQGLSLRPPSLGDALGGVEGTTAPRGLEQDFVYTERPGQNPVSWYEFQWLYYDVSSPSGGEAGIRLYFYRNEREVAERALPVIRSAYLRLVDQFHYTPTKRIPYILYSSQREFQTTNVFEVAESVLGVTSPTDLKMSLPYFGDHEKFREVSTHELVHQFHIQKMLDLAGEDRSVGLVDALPLWFVEGIAEYYSKGGLDPETDGYVRDLLWNPDPERHYQVVAYADDRYRGYIPTYKLGQARIAFIAEVYGKEKIQAYIENAYVTGAQGRLPPGERTFGAVTRRVLGESLEQVDARWRAWLKRRYYPDYLANGQDLPQVEEVRGAPAELEAYAASPDGATIFARGIDREEGRARLYLFDGRHPGRALEVVEDDRPGFESLHPIEQNVLAISDHAIAFTAQDGSGDSLYFQSYLRSGGTGAKPPVLQLGPRRKLSIAHPAGLRFIEVSDPAFSEDESHIAFVGLTERGQRDIYVVAAAGGAARQITDDAYNERDLFWGKDGIYCSSDATDHGLYNLFRIDPGTGDRTRLTTAPANDRHPRRQGDGSVLYSSDTAGKTDLYRLGDGRTQRITDFTTGLWNPAAAPADRAIWAQTFNHGRFRLVEVPRVAWLEQPATTVPPAPGPPLAFPTERFPETIPRYESYALRNWRLENAIVFGGAATNAIAGRGVLLFSDVLRDNLLYVDLAVYGSFSYTQGLVLFENRAHRTAWALGAYQFVTLQFDRLNPTLSFLQRDFGVRGILRFPIDRFRRVEAELNLGGLQRYCLTDEGFDFTFACRGLYAARPEYPTTADWERRNGGVNPIANPVFRFGYDTVRFDRYEGPIDGSSLLFELGGNVVPTRGAVSGFTRLDAERYWHLFGRSKFFLRLASAITFAPNDNSRIWAKSWWLTSADNLRGFYPLDFAYLIGQNYYVVNAELHIPLDVLVRILFFDYMAFVVAFDFGGVFNRWETRLEPSTGRVLEYGAWESRSLTGVLGLNMLIGPLLFRIHFGHPFDIGGEITPAMIGNTAWVTNFSLRYFFF